MVTLNAIRGDDFQVSLTWRGPRNEDGTDGPVIDMTGYTVQVILYMNREVTSWSSAPQVVLTPLAGKIDLHIEDAVTDLWGTDGKLTVRVTSPAGIETSLLKDANIEVC